MLAPRRWFALAVALLPAACSRQNDPQRSGTKAEALILDEVHNEGTPGFLFLPPLVASARSGTLVPALAPVVRIEELSPGTHGTIATFTTPSEVRQSDALLDGHYLVNWDTKAYVLDPACAYRIHVSIQGLEFGFADVKVVGSGSELRNVQTSEYIALLDGRTLPIKFRIEQAAVKCIGVTCSPQDQCHWAGKCDPRTGACSNPSAPDGTACDDGNGCTRMDTCHAGACVGASPVVCTALDPCHDVGTCDALTGACSQPAKANGSPCNDGNACTEADACQSGVCVGGPPVTCAPTDSCHLGGQCDPLTGRCSSPVAPDGSPCDDGNACTRTDTCQAGACVGANPVVCTALDPCHDVGTCDALTGACSQPAKANGSPCNDGNVCTQTDTCQAGACVGSNLLACSGAGKCRERPCDASAGCPAWTPGDDCSLAVGPRHACSIDAAGVLGCWGADDSGQLGDNDAARSDKGRRTAVLVPPGTTWTNVATGASHTCAIKVDGSLWCWGANAEGQLGDNTRVDRLVPVQESSYSTGWRQVATGRNSTCAVKTGASPVWCWGATDSGQDGGGASFGSNPKPTAVVGSSGSVWLAVAVGDDHACALKAVGAGGAEAWCWGSNGSGQVGGTTVGGPIRPLTRVGTETDWGTVSAGHLQSCAVKGGVANAGRLFCWGATPLGMTTPTPTQVGTGPDTWTTASAGDGVTCGAKQSGGVYCLGANDHGQIGNGAITMTPQALTPAAVSSPRSYVAAATRGQTSCALGIDRQPDCWGSNERGTVGLGGVGRKLTPAQVGIETNWAALDSGPRATCALKVDGTLFCAGLNRVGEAGQGASPPASTSPVATFNQAPATGSATGWSSITAGYEQFFGLQGGAPHIWGNATGVSGDPLVTGTVTLPTSVSHGQTWSSISSGALSACAISAGKLFCWGQNSAGEAGGTAGTAIATPTVFGAATTWSAVSLGAFTACGLQADQLLCWGQNTSGEAAQAGGGTFSSAQPVTTPAATGWSSVSVGGAHACGINGGRLYCWGRNLYGQLGVGTNLGLSTPAQVGTAADWVWVGAGESSTCGIRADFSLWCWGLNDTGQLGLGTVTNVNLPSQVGTGFSWVKPARVGPGARGFTCGAKTDGTLWCWGSDEYGAQGDGLGFSAVPAPVQ